ncbi:flagellar basal body L-ring protein FlgH [Sulfurimonas sp. CS5]|uniref:flagellar basal body L-ring protein FlgH n=1 Tax=Sulfurimonas sp. CS5 TaxID=3391145 RepID=UPI0039EAAA88
MLKPILIFFMSSYAILTLTGCMGSIENMSVKMDPEIDFKPPVYVEQMPAKEDKQDYVSTGSIFGQGDNPLFSDHKAMHVNDIVRVVINESAQSTSGAVKELSESGNTVLGGGVFNANSKNIAVNSLVDRANNLGNVGYTSSSESTYSGQGSATKDASFNTIVSARIVKVMENGNYFLSGRREILVDGQKQIIQIGGVIRPYDIDQYNKVDSSKMSDAKILYQTQGELERATKEGWGTNIVKAIWPF